MYLFRIRLVLACATFTLSTGSVLGVPVRELATYGDLFVRQGHYAEVDALAFSADGQFLASGDRDGAIRIWDLIHGRLAGTCVGVTGRIGAVALSREASLLAAGDSEGNLYVWRRRESVCPAIVLSHLDAIRAVDFSPDTTLVGAVDESRDVRIWDVGSGTLFRRIKARCFPEAVRFSSRGETIAVGGDAGFSWWRLTPLTTIGSVWRQDLEVKAVSIRQDNSCVALASERDNTLSVWRIAHGNVSHTAWARTRAARLMALSRGGTVAAVADEHTGIFLCRLGAEKRRRLLQAKLLDAASLAVSAEGKLFATGGFDGSVTVQQAASGNQVQKFWGVARHDWRVARVGQETLAAVSENHLLVWQTASNRVSFDRLALRGHGGATSIGASKDGAVLAVGSYQGRVELVFPGDAHGRVVVQRHRQGYLIRGLFFAPDGRTLATLDASGLLSVYDVAANALVNSYRVSSTRLVAQVSAHGYLVAVPDGRYIKIWDWRSGKVVHSILQPDAAWCSCVSFTPDGRHLACGVQLPGGAELIRIWDVNSEALVKSWAVARYATTTMAWSPDGQSLAVATTDNIISVWDASAGSRIMALRGHIAPATQVLWMDRGRLLVSAAGDGTIKLWRSRTGRLLRTLVVLSPGGSDRRTKWVIYAPRGSYLGAGELPGQENSENLHERREAPHLQH